MRPSSIGLGSGSPMRRLITSTPVTLGLLLLAAANVHASGNPIPGSWSMNRSWLGLTLAPYASPGDVVTLGLHPVCSGSSPGLGATPTDNVVTIVVRPTAASGGPSAAVVLATDCSAVETSRQQCAGRPDLSSITCIQVNGSGEDPALAVDTYLGQQVLRVRWPDTDALLPPVDGLGFAGPAAIAVTAPSEPLPCGLASESCGLQSNVLACIGDFFETDGTCDTATPHSVFPHFTALPPRNNFAAQCSDGIPCTGSASETQMTTDNAGNLLVPIDWSGVLPGQSVPVAQFVRGSTGVGAFVDGGSPIVLPGEDFVRSYTIDGQLLPPVLSPQMDAAATNELSLFGTPEAAGSVIRIQRRSSSFLECAGGTRNGLPCDLAGDCPDGTCGPATCNGGDNDGATCTNDADCSDGGGECGRSWFEFRGRNFGGVGPVAVSLHGSGVCQNSGSPGTACSSDLQCPGSYCAAYRFSANERVPLEGAHQTDLLNAFIAEEPISDLDLNGDGDKADHVVELANKETGFLEAIGAGGARGRAITMVQPSPPTRFAALAVENDAMAFLEPEPTQGFLDANANKMTFDTLLRVYGLGPVNLSPGGTSPRAADAAPVIDGQSLAISGGKVFARVSEQATAKRHMVRASVSSSGVEGNGHSLYAAVSGDGRTVAYTSHASNLVDGDTNNYCDRSGWGGGTVNCADVFVHDVNTGTTVRVSVRTDGAEANHSSTQPSLSYDGRFVAFNSSASNLGPIGGGHVYVHDRDLDGNGIFDETGSGNTSTVMVDVTSDGTPAGGFSATGFQAISADGRYVFFSSSAALVPDDTNGVNDSYVRDRDLDGNGIFDEPGASNGKTERLSVRADGSQFTEDRWCLYGLEMSSTPCVQTSDCPGTGAYCLQGGIINDTRASADGRYLVFGTYSQQILPAGHAQYQQVFVKDRVTGALEQVSLTDQGDYPNGACFTPVISADGRFATFTCWATNMVPGDTNGSRDLFVRDRTLGTTKRVSLNNDGAQIAGDTEFAATSADGRYVAWRSFGVGYVPNHVYDTQFQAYLHDNLTGMTARVSNRPDGGQSESGHFFMYSGVNMIAVSGDGGNVTFTTTASDILETGTKTNNVCNKDDWNNTDTDQPCMDVYAYTPDPADPLGADLSGDGDFAEAVLDTVDTTSGAERLLCPASAVSVANGRTAFLSAESAGRTPGLSCPQNSAPLVGGLLPDLNGDGDATDNVVLYWDGSGAVANLHCAAVDVAISSTHIAALVSEADSDLDLDADGLKTHNIVMMHELADPAPVDCSGWINTGEPATEMRLSGGVVAFTSSEADAGVTLNGDADLDDLVLQVFIASTQNLTSMERAVDDFVIGTKLVAFRVSEAAQGNTDHNNDGDTLDSILQAYNWTTGELYDSNEAAVPCKMESCDPELPYRVFDDTVKFLSFESAPVAAGPVAAGPVQLAGSRPGESHFFGSSHFLGMFNSKSAVAMQIGASHFWPTALLEAFWASEAVADSAAVTRLASAPSGVCSSTSGDACIPDGEPCPDGGVCFVPPGVCAREQTGSTCNIAAMGACGSNGFCKPLSGVSGVCYQKENICSSKNDCTSGAICVSANQTFNRLTSPMGDNATGGNQLFVSAGRCYAEGTSCVTNADCAFGDACDPSLVGASAADSDADEVPDPFDNCPYVPNANQYDSDVDGVGNACDLLATCGDGLLAAGEACDDGDPDNGDGCSASCQIEDCYQCDGGSPSICTTSDALSCDDGLFCNGTETCTAGVCEHSGSPCGAECRESCSETNQACIYASEGVPCTQDGNPCTLDQCDGLGSCSHPAGNEDTPCEADTDVCTLDVCSQGTCSHLGRPAPDCRQPTKSVLKWKQSLAEPDKNKFGWKYKKGSATSYADFSDPVSGTASYTMCVYDGSDRIVARTVVAPGGTCDNGLPCWTKSSSGKLQFKDKSGSQNGVTGIKLKPGPDGKSDAQVKGGGSGSPVLDLPLDGEVSVQLVNGRNGVCWAVTYGAADVAQNAADGKLTAKKK